MDNPEIAYSISSRKTRHRTGKNRLKEFSLLILRTQRKELVEAGKINVSDMGTMIIVLNVKSIPSKR